MIRSSRLRRQASSWLAIAAMLMAALAPSLSQALRQDSMRSWLEICSAVPSGDSHAPGPAGDEHAFEHCPYCSIHAATLGLPPAPWLVLPPGAMPSEAAPSLAIAPRTHDIWSAAQARAAPRLS